MKRLLLVLLCGGGWGMGGFGGMMGMDGLYPWNCKGYWLCNQFSDSAATYRGRYSGFAAVNVL